MCKLRVAYSPVQGNIILIVIYFTTQRIHKKLFTISSHQHNNNIYNKHNSTHFTYGIKFSAFLVTPVKSEINITVPYSSRHTKQHGSSLATYAQTNSIQNIYIQYTVSQFDSRLEFFTCPWLILRNLRNSCEFSALGARTVTFRRQALDANHFVNVDSFRSDFDLLCTSLRCFV